MSRATDDERHRAWLNLVQTHRVLVDALEERLQAVLGLSLPEHELLIRLANAPEGRLRMLDLANLLLVSKSGVTRLVDRVEKDGLVKRKLSPTDRRVTYAVVTDAGRAALERSIPVFRDGLEAVFSRHLSNSDVGSLRRALRKILQGNGVWEETRCSPTIEVAAEETPEKVPAGS